MQNTALNFLNNLASNMSVWHINYCVNISLTHGFIYFENPKVACSFIKSVLQKLECFNNVLTPPSEMTPPSEVHVRESSPFIQPFQLQVTQIHEVLTHPDFYKFTFVRNPFTRALSAYLGKLCSTTFKKRLFLSKLGYPRDYDGITFKEFLIAISKQKIQEMDIHWRPQCYQVFYSLIDYSYIGRFEQLDNDFIMILKKIYPEVNSDDYIVDEDPTNVTKASQRLKSFYGPDECELVLEIYKKDFEIFKYENELP